MHPTFARSTLPAASLALLLAGSASALPLQAPVARNLRQAWQPPFDFEPQAAARAFFQSEHDQGGRDLNGDGDALDVVLRVAPAGSGPVIGPALAVESFESLQMVGDRVAFEVDEAAQGFTDLDGDGEANDLVLHLYDAGSGQVTNLRRTKLHGGMRLTETSLFLFVSEMIEGADLNGDGDLADIVLSRIDLATGVERRFPLAVDTGVQLVPPLVAGDLAVVLVPEDWQGQDLNGDGKMDDRIPFVVDAAAGWIHDMRYSVSDHPSVSLPVVVDGQVVYALPEVVAGADLNGDGDLEDDVVQVLLPGAGARVGTRLALAHAGLLRAAGGRVAVGVSEADQGGADLNGDGDTLDAVAYLFDVATSSAIGSGVAVRDLLGLQRGVLAFSVEEAAQGGADLNGDGDAADIVLHLLDVRGAPVTNLGLALRTKKLSYVTSSSGRMTAFLVNEGAQGFTDLNGDGDLTDEVWFVHDLALGVTTNMRLAWTPLGNYPYVHAGDDFVFFAAGESASGGRDLNGDGDAFDQVLQLFQAGSSLPVNLGTGLGSSYYGFGTVVGRRLLIGIPESVNGDTDLNGDGDAFDRVAHVVDVP